MTTDHEVPAPSDGVQTSAPGAFEEQRALLQELQWAYKRAVAHEQLESGVETLTQQVRKSTETQTAMIGALERRIEGQQRSLGLLKDEAAKNDLAETLVERVNRISKRTWRMESEVKALNSAVSSISESLERIEAALGVRSRWRARRGK